MASEIDVVEDLIRAEAIIHFWQLAAAVIAAYDHALTFDMEVDLIWRRRWSTSKILFLCTRYVGEIVLISEFIVPFKSRPSAAYCLRTFQLVQWGSATVLWTTQLILQLRVYAMYNNSRKIAIIIAGMFFSEIVIMSVDNIAANMTSHAIPQPFPGVYVCLANNIPAWSSMFWIPMIAFEVLLFVLACIVCAQHLREIRTMNRWNRKSVMNVLFRDNIGYFFVALFGYVTSAIFWFGYVEWSSIPAGMAYALTIIMGCRLVLNLCEAYDESCAARGASVWAGSIADSDTDVHGDIAVA